MGAQQQMLLAAAAAGLIVSIQPIAITIAGGASTNTQTVTSVTTANSCIVFGGCQNTDSTTIDGSNDYGYLTLTNSTTVTATRAGTAATTLTIKGTLIQWKSSAIKSIQTGTIVIGSGATSNTATITSVTATNAIC